MQVRQVMTDNVEYVASQTTLKQAAELMRDMDCGFLPIGDNPKGKLLGVVTDRDIAVRAIADGKDPMITPVSDALTRKVMYCFQDDDLQEAAKSMEEQRIYRLVVLDNADDKRMCGIISLGDILRHNQTELAARAAGKIAA